MTGESASGSKLEKTLGRIQRESERLLQISAGMNTGSRIGGAELLVLGAAKRTLSLTTGFVTLVRGSNMICARALLRMQLDTVVRFGALAIVENPEDFAQRILGGEETRNLTCRDGRRLTDRYLVDRMAEIAPWLPAVYRDTSGYVHFSATAIFASVARMDEATRRIDFAVTDRDENLPESTWLELAEIFERLVIALIGLVGGWRDINRGKKSDKSE